MSFSDTGFKVVVNKERAAAAEGAAEQSLGVSGLAVRSSGVKASQML